MVAPFARRTTAVTCWIVGWIALSRGSTRELPSVVLDAHCRLGRELRVRQGAGEVASELRSLEIARGAARAWRSLGSGRTGRQLTGAEVA
jgi:hypothetical protein